MATTTYNPNDANCSGWDGDDEDRPPDTLVMSVEAALTAGELDTISADDASSVSYPTGRGTGFAPGHHLRFAINETPANVTQLTPTAKGYGSEGGATLGYYLYIWDANGSVWELLDSHVGAAKDTVTANVVANITNYIHDIAGTNYVDILLMGQEDAGIPPALTVYTYYAELAVTAPVLTGRFVSGRLLSMTDAYEACTARGRNTRMPQLWDGLVGLWMPSAGIQGGRLLDWSGYGNHGTLTNMDPATDWVATRYGSGLDFDGNNDFVDLDNPDCLQPSSISVFVWTYVRTGDAMLVHSGAAPYSYNIYVDPTNGHARIELDTVGDPTASAYGSTDVRNDWHLIGITYDAASGNNGLYVDAINEGAIVGISGPLDTNAQSVGIGAQVVGSLYPLDGIIVSVSIHNRALLPSEIRALYADPQLLIRPRRRAFWSVAEIIAAVADAGKVTALVRDEVTADVGDKVVAVVQDPVTVAARG